MNERNEWNDVKKNANEFRNEREWPKNAHTKDAKEWNLQQLIQLKIYNEISLETVLNEGRFSFQSYDNWKIAQTSYTEPLN